MRKSYDVALIAAQRCPEVTKALGSPLTGRSASYQQTGVDSAKHLRASGSISGPKGNGALEYEALGDGDKWALVRGTVVVDGKAIDLLSCGSSTTGAP